MRLSRPALCNFIGSALLYTGLVYASHVKEHALDMEWSTARFWGVFGAVQALIAIGYCMSCLPKWGKWVDGQADTEYKLSLIAGIFFAVSAGNIAYYLSFYEINAKLLYSMVSALAGGFAGEKWLAPFLMKFLPASAPSPRQPGS